MKVICIDGKNMQNPFFTGPLPIEGKEYNVKEEGVYEGMPEYRFVETGDFWYSKYRFAPLSEKDEREYSDEVLKKMFEPVKIKENETLQTSCI